MTPFRPLTDRCLEILSTSKLSMGAETSSSVAWKGGGVGGILVEEVLR